MMKMMDVYSINDAVKYLEKKYRANAQGKEYKNVEDVMGIDESITLEAPASYFEHTINLNGLTNSGMIPTHFRIAVSGIAQNDDLIQAKKVIVEFVINGEIRRRYVEVWFDTIEDDIFPIVVDSDDVGYIKLIVEFADEVVRVNVSGKVEYLTRRTHDEMIPS